MIGASELIPRAEEQSNPTTNSEWGDGGNAAGGAAKPFPIFAGFATG